MVTQEQFLAVTAPATLQPVTKPVAPRHLELRLKAKHATLSYRLQQRCKRAFDLTAAALGLLALAPSLAALALAVKLSSPGPVLYASKRLGRHRQPFPMFKFRSMQVGADALRETLRQQHGQEGELFKLKDDPRVTPLGALLRKYSLDEFPQLLNVLRGEMSLVGPRPFSPDNCRYFEPPHTLRFEATPGMTGAWQVSGRSDLGLREAAELELDYLMNWSLWLDAKILLQTLPAVLLKKGSF